MPKGKKQDIDVIASSIVATASSEVIEISILNNPNPVALGRLGGLKGGKARASKLTPEQRKEIVKKPLKRDGVQPNN